MPPHEAQNAGQVSTSNPQYAYVHWRVDSQQAAPFAPMPQGVDFGAGTVSDTRHTDAVSADVLTSP